MKTDVTTQSITEKIRTRIIPLVSIGVGFAFIGAAGLFFWNQSANRGLPDRLTCASQQFAFGVSRDQPAEQQAAASLPGLNDQLIIQERQYKQTAQPKDRATIQALARDRKKSLIAAMRTDPAAAAQALLPETLRRDLAGLTHNCLEQPVEASGELLILHADNINGLDSENAMMLKTKQGEKWLHLTTGFSESVLSGSTLSVSGWELDGNLLSSGTTTSPVTKQEVNLGTVTVEQATATAIAGDQPTIVLMVNFNNTTQPSLTSATVRNLLFDYTGHTASTGSANTYYQDNSYGSVSFSGAVSTWYTLSIPATCNSSSVLTAAMTAADADVNFTAYKRLVIIAPYQNPDTTSCSWAGLGTLGVTYVTDGQTGNVQLGVTWIKDSFANMYLFSHELGHNFGEEHAEFLRCGASSFCTPTGTTDIRRGDQCDVLGGRIAHFNAAHKEFVGWLTPANLQTVTATGTYTIEPIEEDSTPGAGTSGIKALKIQRSASDYLYLEFRKRTGFDNNLDVPATTPAQNYFQGALLHIPDHYSAYTTFGKTDLIDTSPSAADTQGYFTPALTVGATVTDPNTGTQITTTALTSTLLTVHIVMGKTDFTPPTVTITNPANGTTIGGTITASANASDPSGIQKVDFYCLDSPVTVCSSDSTAPYETSINTTTLSNGSHYLFAKAYDLSGIPFSAPNNESLTENFFTVDNLAPTVALTAPATGALVSIATPVSATASDTNGIQRVEFYRDNDILIATDPGAPYTITWDPRTVTNGSHTLFAKAFDQVGNMMKSAVVTVTVTDSSPGGGGGTPRLIETL